MIVLLLFACGRQQSLYTLEGCVGGGYDTLYIYGLDDRHQQVDTIVTDADGDFRYTLPTDTVVPLTLILQNGMLLPVYAEPDVEATLAGSNDCLRVQGGELQALHDSIVSRLDSIAEQSQRYDAIDEFIKLHPYSDVNIYLLQHYFVDIDDARGSLVRNRIEMMGGTLQDNSYISSIKRAVSVKQQNIQHRSAPEFELQAMDGSVLRRADYKDKYLLMTFWASWDSASVNYLRELRVVAETADTANFKMISISLDYDTVAWKQMISNDTLPGSHVCDARMWESSVVKEFTISKLPFTVLVNPYMRVDEFNVSPEWLAANIDSLTASYQSKLNRKSAVKSIKKVKSSRQVIKKEEPKKVYEKKGATARPRPGMQKASGDRKAQPVSL